MSDQVYEEHGTADEPATQTPPRQEDATPEPSAAPPAQPQSPAVGESKKGGGCARGCLLVTVAIIGAIVGSIVASTFLPWLILDIPPWKLTDRNYIRKTVDEDRPLERIVRTVVAGKGSADSVVAVAAKVSPSVVFISTAATENDLLLGTQQVEGQGSGVIYRSDGYIITNNHVVSGAQQIYVKIGNEAAITGKVVGTDSESDLAIVKVNRKNLPAADFGDSSKIEVGELAVAVGAPFGLEKTVTTGVVSALHRNSVAQNQAGQTVTYANLIQTDAAINPGNSGGALANARGQVIGINTLIRSTSGSSAGIGFAIPIGYVKTTVKQLMAGKTVGHAFIGIVPAPVTQGGPHSVPGVTEGAYVSRALEGGPAARAGIRAGDVIVEVGGSPVKVFEDLFATVRSHQPGDKVKVVFLRGKKRETVTVTLTSRPVETQPKAGVTR